MLAKTDEGLGPCEEIACHVSERRGSSIHHSLLMLLRQRLNQIAAGYEDQNGSDSLLKAVLERLTKSPRWSRRELYFSCVLQVFQERARQDSNLRPSLFVVRPAQGHGATGRDTGRQNGASIGNWACLKGQGGTGRDTGLWYRCGMNRALAGRYYRRSGPS